MKRVLSWLCFIMALAVWPQTALAYSPSKMYILYNINGEGWTARHEMPKSGSTFTYTFPKAVENGKEVYFMLASDHLGDNFASSAPSTTTDWNILQGNAWVQYTPDVNQVDNGSVSVSNGTKLIHRGNVTNVMKISTAGIHTLNLTLNNDYYSYNQGLTLNYSTQGSGEHNPDPVETEYYFGYRRSGNVWMHNNPVTLKDGVYTFSFNNLGTQGGASEDALFYITTDDVNDWTDNRFHGSDTNNDCNVTNGASLSLKNVQKTLYIKDTGRGAVTVTFVKEGSGIKITGYTVSPTLLPDWSGNFYYGYHGDNAKWVHNSTPLVADGNGVYSFEIDNKMNQNQYFYITDCSTAGENRLANGFPKHRYVDNNDVFDYGVSADNNPPLARQETRTVLYVPDSKNHKITVKFTYNQANGTINLLTEAKPNGVITDERTKTNLPLLPRHFFKDEAQEVVRPHYFIVGTRMADWKLQPEWEMTQVDANTYEISSPRVMYSGLISVAKVQRYDNYANNRYTRYASSAGGFHIKPNAATVPLTEKGPYAFYRDLSPNQTEADIFFSKAGNYNAGLTGDIVLKDLGVVCDKIILKVDAEGNPTSLEFKYTEKPVTDYITLSLVGGKINNEGLPESKMTQATLVSNNDPTDTWQDAWVQYNPETGVPYRDASGMLIYQTVFQSDWLDSHPTFFNKKIAGGRDFNYTSQSIVMRNANSFTEDELAEDPYAAYYDRFKNASDKKIGTANGYKNVQVAGKFNFNEYLYYHGSANAESLIERQAADWQCFVVKDMWMDDFFKIWTGWGGGRKYNEYAGNAEPQNARWYYQNGGSGHGMCHNNTTNTGCVQGEVSGYDIAKNNNNTEAYATMRDYNQADFHIKNLTYFKRVIVWYDPANGFDNAVVQLLIERCGPAIQAFRGELGSQIDYEWNIPDPEVGLTPEEKALPVRGYRIYRYKLNDATGQFELNGTNPVEDVTCSNGETIETFMDKQKGIDSNLKAGTYRYRVEVDMTDADGLKLTRDAWSNRVTLFDASVPVKGDAYQVTEEKDGKTYYSFDMALDIDINNYLVSALYEGHGVNDLAEGYYITVDPAVMDDFNNARHIDEEGNASACLYTCHGTDPKPIPAFQYDPSNPLEQMVNGKLVKTDRAWIHIPFSQGHIAKKLVWENMVKSQPDKDYNFQLFLKRNPEYENIFAAANFGMNEVDAPFVIPAVEVEYIGSQVVTDLGGDEEDAADQIFGHKNTPQAFMPMGSHHGADNLHAPVHYTQANRLDAKFAISEPAVTDKVKANYELSYAASDDDVKRELLTPCDLDGVMALGNQEGLDVELLWTPLDLDADGKTYYALDPAKKLFVYANADVKYIRNTDKESMSPEAMSSDKGEADIKLVAPDFTAEARALTNEQVAVDQKRYYVHELQMNLNFRNINESGMVVRPGFHIKPVDHVRPAEFASDHGNSSVKAANGGIVAYDGVKNGSEFYAYLPVYTPFKDTYDNASDNWAKLSADQGRLPVYVDYFSAREKKAGDTDAAWQWIPKIGGYVVYHYPFIVKREKAGAASVRALRAPLAADENNIKTLTAVGGGAPLNVTPDMMTSIDSIEADDDLSDAEFYNLQGIRVDNPVSGQVYLMRRDGVVCKVVMK